MTWMCSKQQSASLVWRYRQFCLSVSGVPACDMANGFGGNIAVLEANTDVTEPGLLNKNVIKWGSFVKSAVRVIEIKIGVDWAIVI